MLNALTRGVADAVFVYPWVSILPRLIFGLASGVLFEIIKKKSLKKQLYLIPIGTFIATFFFHTWVVFFPYFFSYAYLFQHVTPDRALFILAATSFASSGALEAFVAAIVVPVIIFAIEKEFREIKKHKTSSYADSDSDSLGYGKLTKEKKSL